MKAREHEPSQHVGPAVQLRTGLEKSLSAYATAAAVTGVSLLAFNPSAEAKVVYTPAGVNIPVNADPVLLDLNHDGTADFSFVNKAWSGSEGEFALLVGVGAEQPGNEAWGRGAFSSSLFHFNGPFATALRPDFSVGANKAYFQKNSHWLMAKTAGAGSTANVYSKGQWFYTQNRYLGLKFTFSGHTHYGWARLTVTLKSPNLISHGIQATLTGYAYETIPDKPIITGKTKGPDVITFEPATLGHLAQGASGISAWREKK